MRPRTDPLLALAIALGAARPLWWIATLWSSARHGVSPVSAGPPEWDFSLFWLSGLLARAHQIPALMDLAAFRALAETHLHFDPGDTPFLYPPIFLLATAPLSRLPLLPAYLLWTVGGALAFATALRRAGATRETILLALLSPAFLTNLLLGQNGAFTGALLIAALAPATGAAAGLLAFKPSLGPILPVAYLATRNLRAFASAGALGLLLALASLHAFGAAAWHGYFSESLAQARRILDLPFPQPYQVSGISLFWLVRALGGGIACATAIQTAAALLAAASAAWLLREPRLPAQPRLAALLALGLLATPYAYVFDMTGLAGALALTRQAAGKTGLAWALLWIAPAFARDITRALGLPLMPALLAALPFLVWPRERAARP